MPKYVICKVMTFVEGFMVARLMVTSTDDDDDNDNRVNIEQSASRRWNGRVLQLGYKASVISHNL